MKSAIITACLLLLAASIATAGSLEKRHQLELKLGMWTMNQSQTEINTSSVSTSFENEGLLAGFSYGHWLEEHVEFTIGFEVMSVTYHSETIVGAVSERTSVVAPILMGVKLYVPQFGSDGSVRPHARLSIGPFVGSQSNTEIDSSVTVESRSEVALGGQVGAGVEFILSRHILTGATFAYSLVGDFDEPIGGSENYSGPSFGFTVSFVFGKGAD
jgi:opacity protein-like surface antigen